MINQKLILMLDQLDACFIINEYSVFMEGQVFYQLQILESEYFDVRFSHHDSQERPSH